MILDGDHQRPWKDGEERLSRIVFIGRDLPEEKIRTGFMRALHKRPVPTEYVDQAINRIEQRVLALGEREIASRVIGEMVMRELKKMDDVAYIRFASVYEDFQRVDDFREAILEVKKPSSKRTRRAAK